MVLQGCGDCGSWEKNIAVLVPTNSFSHYNGTIPSIVLRVCHFPITRSTFLGALQLFIRNALFFGNFFVIDISSWIFLSPFLHIQKKLAVLFLKSREQILSIGQSPELLSLSNGCTLLDLPLTFFYLPFFNADRVLSTFKKKIKISGGISVCNVGILLLH